MKVYEDSNKVEQASDLSYEQMTADLNLDAAIQELPADEFEINSHENKNYIPKDVAVSNLEMILQIVPVGLELSGAPKTAEIWSDDIRNKIASKILPVLNKFSFGRTIITYLEAESQKEFIDLGMVLAPVVMASYAMYMLEKTPKEKVVESADSEAIKPNPARTAQGIELANASDIDYDAKN